MEIFDVTQTDPSLLVSDSMGIQYSMDDQVSDLPKFLLIVDFLLGAAKWLHIASAPLFGPFHSRLKVSSELCAEPGVPLTTRVPPHHLHASKDAWKI